MRLGEVLGLQWGDIDFSVNSSRSNGHGFKNGSRQPKAERLAGWI